MKSFVRSRSSSTVTPGSPDRASSTLLGHSLQVMFRAFVMPLTSTVIWTPAPGSAFRPWGSAGFFRSGFVGGPGSCRSGRVPQPAAHNASDAANSPVIPVRMLTPLGSAARPERHPGRSLLLDLADDPEADEVV